MLSTKRKKPPPCGVSPLHSLSLALPQIKISVIKLIKVMHANMPLGSKPDFIQHTVVESCRSFTFDVAFFIIEHNWIPSPSPTPPHPPLSCMHKHTNRFFFFLYSGPALLIDPLRCGAGAESLLHTRGLGEKRERFKQPRQCAEGRHFNRGQGSFCRLDWRLPVSESSETCGSGGKAYGGSVALPPYQLGWAYKKKRASPAHRQLASLHTQRNGW